MIGWVEIVCGIAILNIWLYYYLLAPYDYWKKLKVPGPKPIPIFGNAKDTVFGKIGIAEYIREVYSQYKEHGMFGIFVVREPYLILTDPELIKDVLIKDFSNFTDRGIVFDETVDTLGPNLFNLEAERWRPLRTYMGPAFARSKLKDMFQMISECSEHLAKVVAKLAEKEESVEVHDLTTRFTTDVMGTCAFGIDTNAFTTEDCDFHRFGKVIFEPFSANMLKFSFAQYMPSVYKLLAPFMEPKSLNTFIMDVTLSSMKYRRQRKIYRNDFINTLLELQDHSENLGDLQLTDQLIVAQAYIFFAAGFETSSTTMSNALYELALHQNIQSKLREEIREMYSNSGNLDSETIKEMQYLDAVLRETLRKYPPFVNLRRRAKNSYTFKNTKVTIPKGQKLMIPVYAIHRDPNIYPNPDVFDPDRFLERNEATRHSMHYLPFGNGPRNCIGSCFAVHQMKIGLIKIIQHYKIDVCEKTPIPYVVHPRTYILSPLEPINLRISKCDDS